MLCHYVTCAASNLTNSIITLLVSQAITLF